MYINHPIKWLVLAFTQIDPALVNSHVVMPVGMDGYVNIIRHLIFPQPLIHHVDLPYGPGSKDAAIPAARLLALTRSYRDNRCG